MREVRERSMIDKRGLLGLALLALTNGCAGIAAIEGPGALERYVNCNTENALRRTSSEGDTVRIAIEAEASCAHETLALARVYQRSVGTDQARDLLDGIRQATIASNATSIAMNCVQ